MPSVSRSPNASETGFAPVEYSTPGANCDEPPRPAVPSFTVGEPPTPPAPDCPDGTEPAVPPWPFPIPPPNPPVFTPPPACSPALPAATPDSRPPASAPTTLSVGAQPRPAVTASNSHVSAPWGRFFGSDISLAG